MTNQLNLTLNKKRQMEMEDKTLKPNYLRKLHSYVGTKKLAELIGCSTSLITDGLKNESVRAAYELAAELIYTTKYDTGSKKKVAVVSASDRCLALVEEMVGNVGGKFMMVEA